MRKIVITDRTLVAASLKAGTTLSFKEKVEIARLLETAGTDVAEFPAIENEKTDTLFLRTASAFLKNTVLSVAVSKDEAEIETAWNAVKGAGKPRITVCLPVSPAGMEYLCHKKGPKMLLHIEGMVKKAASLCEDVAFTALDATRSEPDFLAEAARIAIASGAKTVTVCDDEAVMLPDSFEAFIQNLQDAVPAFEGATLGIQCANKFGCALASSMLAVRAGASAICVAARKCNTATLEETANLLRNCGEKEGYFTGIRYTEISRLSKQIDKIATGARSETNPFDNGASPAASPAGIALTKSDTLPTVIAAVKKLGYDLSEEDYQNVYESFGRVAEKKPVSDKELDAIVASAALQVPPTYSLKSYVINTGNIIHSSAQIELIKDNKILNGISVGDGPIDAAFLTIEQIIGHHYELDDFQIQAVTEGREAMGSAIVRLRSGGKLYSGNGISTDIIGASIRAYISALNKITFEEA